MARGGLLDNARQKGAFDVAIVGAGYAGLSSALLIGRYLVTAVIFDGGATRNSMTRRVHGYPGFENISPKMLVGKMHADVKKYRSVNMVGAALTELEGGEDILLLDQDRKHSLQSMS